MRGGHFSGTARYVAFAPLAFFLAALHMLTIRSDISRDPTLRTYMLFL